MKSLQIAVGVVKNADGKILIALRDLALHQGGLWEFPGGKIEAGETSEQALIRELKEEVDITVITATPLITVNHQYPDLAVRLQVFLVENFSGIAKSAEGQPIQWIKPCELANYTFPAANRPIIAAAQLPPCYAILDDSNEALLVTNLQKILSKGVKLIQARLKTLSTESVSTFIEQAYPLCQQQGAWLLINSAVTANIIADGIHLTSRHLMATNKRPAAKKWVAASCHNLQELQHAESIGVDFVVLAPVLATKTHPDVEPLGWQQFSELTSKINLPVYALGGMSKLELVTAQQAGGQGIAAIRAFLD